MFNSDREAVRALVEAIEDIASAWETGSLAEAVNRARRVAEEAKKLPETTNIPE